MGKNTKVCIFEHYVSIGASTCFNTTVNEIQLNENAQLTHIRLQNSNKQTFHVNYCTVAQKSHSHYENFSYDFGGRLIRNDLVSHLHGPESTVSLHGLYLLKGNQHVDNHTQVHHHVPHTISKESYKGILKDRSRGIFNGRVVVAKDAQKTSAEQSNHNLLLSKKAEIDTKPQLEIYADNVKCTHGATVGQLDEDMLYYLQCRGIDGEAARDLLIYGFAHTMTEILTIDAIRANIQESLLSHMSHADFIRELTYE